MLTFRDESSELRLLVRVKPASSFLQGISLDQSYNSEVSAHLSLTWKSPPTFRGPVSADSPSNLFRHVWLWGGGGLHFFSITIPPFFYSLCRASLSVSLFSLALTPLPRHTVLLCGPANSAQSHSAIGGYIFQLFTLDFLRKNAPNEQITVNLDLSRTF